MARRTGIKQLTANVKTYFMKPKLHPTQNDLREKVRRAMIDLLNQLADVLDLGLQTKQAHWNVKGPHFGTTTRKAINTAAEAGDADTADLFTEVSRGVDKLLWLVEAHLQAKE